MTICLPRAPNGRPFRVVGQLDQDASVVEMINGVNQAFGDFRQRQDARLTELQQNQEELNRRIAAASVNPGEDAPPTRFGGQFHITNELREDLLGVMRGMQPTMSASVGSDPDGGYLVEREVDNEILAVIRNRSAMRRLALNATLSPGFGSWKKVVNRVGSTAGWAGESDTRSETNAPTLGAVEIFPSEHYALPKVSNYLLDDAGFDVESFLENDVGAEFAASEAAAFANGDGSNKPRGLFQHPTSTDTDAARAFGTLQYLPTGVSGGFSGTSASPSGSPHDILIDLIDTLKPGYRDNASSLMNPTTASTLRKVKDQDGRFIWTDSLIVSQPAQLMGYPVELDENVPSIGADSLSIAFGDFQRGYVIVDRPGLSLVRDAVTEKGWTKFFWYRRVGGRVLDSNAIKLLKFSAS